MRVLTYRIPEAWEGRTVEAFLRQAHGFSARILHDMKESPTGMLRNGEHIRSVDRLREGDVLRLELPEEEKEGLCPSAIRVPVIYEDEDIIVYDKPADMPSHPAKRYQQDTLANVYAADWMRKNGGEAAPIFRPVNRLDRNTTGLVIAAKHPYAASRLGGQVEYNRMLKRGETPSGKALQVEKMYLALASGVFDAPEGEIELPIRRLNEQSTVRIVPEDGSGQYALTRYRVLAQGEHAALLQVQIKTGRTHQIRVHFAHLGHPLLGDEVYGGDTSLVQVQMLRCCQLSFSHPVTDEAMVLRAPLSGEMERVALAHGISLADAEKRMLPDLFSVE